MDRTGEGSRLETQGAKYEQIGADRTNSLGKDRGTVRQKDETRPVHEWKLYRRRRGKKKMPTGPKPLLQKTYGGKEGI